MGVNASVKLTTLMPSAIDARILATEEVAQQLLSKIARHVRAPVFGHQLLTANLVLLLLLVFMVTLIQQVRQLLALANVISHGQVIPAQLVLVQKFRHQEPCVHHYQVL